MNRTVQVRPKKGNRCHRKWNIMFRLGSHAQMTATPHLGGGPARKCTAYNAPIILPYLRHELAQLRRIACTRLQSGQYERQLPKTRHKLVSEGEAATSQRERALQVALIPRDGTALGWRWQGAQRCARNVCPMFRSRR